MRLIYRMHKSTCEISKDVYISWFGCLINIFVYSCMYLSDSLAYNDSLALYNKMLEEWMWCVVRYSVLNTTEKLFLIKQIFNWVQRVSACRQFCLSLNNMYKGTWANWAVNTGWTTQQLKQLTVNTNKVGIQMCYLLQTLHSQESQEDQLVF